MTTITNMQRFRRWLSRRGALVIFLLFAVTVWALPEWIEKPPPTITHTLASSTTSAETIWLKQGIFTKITYGSNGLIYAMPDSRENITAIDINNGNIIWKTDLPLERGGGAIGLLAIHDKIFVITSMFVDAYEASTGNLKWSTQVGKGHVRVLSQLESNMVRIYYGDDIIEVDQETGTILRSYPINNVKWKIGDVSLTTSPSNFLTAFEKQNDEPLWKNDLPFYISEGLEPIDAGDGELIVGFIEGICKLNLLTGMYVWCHPKININNTTVDIPSQHVFAMTNDLKIFIIDLETGNVIGQSSFLSSAPMTNEISVIASLEFGNGVLVVSLNDSGQTFGIKFK